MWHEEWFHSTDMVQPILISPQIMLTYNKDPEWEIECNLSNKHHHITRTPHDVIILRPCGAPIRGVNGEKKIAGAK